jgi:hypothetical protein
MDREHKLTYSSSELLKIIYESKAVTIWDRSKGPVFWYVLSVPGPFYANTELMLGANLAANLLARITSILAETTDTKRRAEELNALILEAFEKDRNYQEIITSLVTKTKAEFQDNDYTIVSGGERRDWLFSIPFAAVCGVKHAFLFKDKSVYCKTGLGKNEKALHVADLINNAESYFDAWLPALEETNIDCIGTSCIISRNVNGLNRLAAAGKKVVPLIRVDVNFFEQSLASQLIDADTLEELKVFYISDKEWASKYLLNQTQNITGLFDVDHLDEKSFARLMSFFTKDPWGMRATHENFFTAMVQAISERQRR